MRSTSIVFNSVTLPSYMLQPCLLLGTQVGLAVQLVSSVPMIVPVPTLEAPLATHIYGVYIYNYIYMHSGASKHAPIPTYVTMCSLKEICTHTCIRYYLLHMYHRNSLQSQIVQKGFLSSGSINCQRSLFATRQCAGSLRCAGDSSTQTLSSRKNPVNRKPFCWGNNL